MLEPRHALGEAFASDVLEILVEREALRHAERRQMVLPFRNRDVATLGNEHRVAECLGVIFEDGRHLFGRLEKELISRVAEALGIVDGLAGADAEQNVVRLVVALSQVVHVVGRDQRQPEIARKRNNPAIDDLLLFDALVLHLEEEVVLAQDVAQPAGGLERRPRLLHLEGAGNLAFQTTAQTD